MRVKVADILLDRAFQCRVAIDQDVAREYGEAMKAGTTFPAVRLFNVDGALFLVDGWHRHRGAELAELAELDAEITTGTRREAQLAAIGANGTHGVRRTNEDKARSILALLQDEDWCKLSARELAGLAKVSHTAVNNERKRFGVAAGELLTEERIAEVTGELPTSWQAVVDKSNYRWSLGAPLKAMRIANTWQGCVKAIEAYIDEGAVKALLQERLAVVCTKPWPWPGDKVAKVRTLDTVVDLEKAIGAEKCPDRLTLIEVWQAARKIQKADQYDVYRLQTERMDKLLKDRPALLAARAAKLAELETVYDRLRPKLLELKKDDTDADQALKILDKLPDDELCVLVNGNLREIARHVELVYLRASERGFKPARCSAPNCRGFSLNDKACVLCFSTPSTTARRQQEVLEAASQLLSLRSQTEVYSIELSVPGGSVSLHRVMAASIAELAAYEEPLRAWAKQLPDSLAEHLERVLNCFQAAEKVETLPAAAK